MTRFRTASMSRSLWSVVLSWPCFLSDMIGLRRGTLMESVGTAPSGIVVPNSILHRKGWNCYA